MRTLEHRRHSRRAPGAVHLSRDGVALARSVGRTAGRFDRVVTSPKPRAVETAEAMRLRVDTTRSELAEVPDDVAGRLDVEAPRSFAEYAALVARSPAVAEFAQAQERLWREELACVPEGGRLLLVSHSGLIELGAVAALPERARAWGPIADYLEGVRFVEEDGRWRTGAVVRVRR